MATATRRHRTITVRLREELTLSFAPLPDGQQRVDHERGIIFGVKVVGPDSPNTHRSGATKGTKYTPEFRSWVANCIREGGVKVNVNHPSRLAPGEDRKAEDGLGELRDSREDGGGVYANLHCLTTHAMWAPLAEAAEKMPGAFALSINASGRGQVIDGWYIVSEGANLQSVDLVRDGGSNSTLFDSREPLMRLSIRQLFEAAKPAIKVAKRPKLAARWKRLFEDDEYGMMDAESPMGETEAPKDPQEALGDGFLAFCTEIIRKCIKDGDDPKECAKEIASHLKTHAGMVGDDTEGEDVEESDEDVFSTEGGQDGKKKEGSDEGTGKQKEDEKKAMEESRKRVTRLAKGFLQLREGQEAPKPLVEALVKLPDEESRLSLLESWPRNSAGGGGGGRAPVGVGPDGGHPAGNGKLKLSDVARAVRG